MWMVLSTLYWLYPNSINIRPMFSTRTAIFILSCLLACANGLAQEREKEKMATQEETVQKIFLSQRYIFIAQSVSPTGGPTRQLTSTYTFRVLQDTIICDLPYFGRVYQPSLSSSDGGINFTSLDFEYTTTERKKGGWDITIMPRDAKNSPRVYFTITADGYASVRISSTDRQAISYNGHIESPNKK